MELQKHIYILLFSLLAVSAMAQHNIVPNPSFEDHNDCPYVQNDFDDLNIWFKPNWDLSSDYYHSCSPATNGNGAWIPNNGYGYQETFDGDAYAGIVLMATTPPTKNYREYLEVKLTESLKKDHKYCVEFYVSLAEKISFYGVNNLGALFTKDSLLITDNVYIHIDTPQVLWEDSIITDTLIWVRFFGDFIAEGGEQFLTIGNFQYDLYCDTIRIKDKVGIPPGWGYCYAYIDMVSVHYCGPDTTPVLPKKILLYPNPSSAEITIEYQNISFYDSHLSLFDIFGRKVFDAPIIESTENKAVIDISTLAAGTYVYHVKANNGMWIKGKLVKI